MKYLRLLNMFMSGLVLSIKNYWQKNPLKFILIIAFVLRLIAVVFSQGYTMHDDHFLVIEASQSWVDGDDYNNWLPWNQSNPKPEGHSFFYVGLHFLFFSLMKFLGITDPVIKMYIVRLIHAFFSLIIVFLGYKITEKISSVKNAKIIGLLLASTWFMPFFSVRNLMEIFCIPFLMIGIWMILIASDKKNQNIHFFWTGLIMCIAFSVRFQTIVFIGGAGLVLLFRKEWKNAVFFGLGCMVSIVIIQGIVDWLIWHRPFAELWGYVEYNWVYKYDYGSDLWFMYISVLMGLFASPVGIFFMIGFFRSWRKYALIFVPSLLFLLFHNLFPNKQERFIFSIVPFYIIIGYIGWKEFEEKIKPSKIWQTVFRWNFYIFIFINIILLSIAVSSYSKRARVETMVYLSKYRSEISNILIEDSNRSSVSMLPCYYLQKWNVIQYLLPKEENIDSSKIYSAYQSSKYVKSIQAIDYYKKADKKETPQFILFYDQKNLEERVNRIKTVFPDIKFETVIEPSLMDKIIHKLNPVNKNMPVYIYRNS